MMACTTALLTSGLSRSGKRGEEQAFKGNEMKMGPVGACKGLGGGKRVSISL